MTKICAGCDQPFEPKNSDEDAIQKARQRIKERQGFDPGPDPKGDLEWVTICDDCYREMERRSILDLPLPSYGSTMTQETKRKWRHQLHADIHRCRAELSEVERRIAVGETPSLMELLKRIGTLQGHMKVFRAEQKEAGDAQADGPPVD